MTHPTSRCHFSAFNTGPRMLTNREEAERQGVRLMSAAMRDKLRLNRNKGDWTQYTLRELVELLDIEVAELKEELRRQRLRPDFVWHEAADVANYAMMVAWNVQYGDARSGTAE